ncbi:DUF2868 domain-containing protein [Nitrosococcus wardiae]|uniref:DUF2868 domain-containing protein n=1 Tax=Nitrosococcus wardiae TaxID=1814290 RepID=UPI00141A8BA1|nr:DUF2868 domain-containing protein [Nitrosococcus wardiae]
MRPNLDRRLLAEAVRFHEEAQGPSLNEDQADTVGRKTGGNLEQRIIARAQSLSIAPSLQEALHQLHSAFALATVIGLVLAIFAGATTARMALGSETEGPVNFFWVLGSILGVNTIALIAWITLIFIQPGITTTGSLGAAAFALGRRLNYWLHKGPPHVAAAQAVGSVYARSPIGRWTLSAVSHAIWLAFLVSSLVLAIFLLSIKEYSFAWETTILSDRTYVALTRTLASVPEALGFTTPDTDQIVASHWTGTGDFSPEAREAWSGLLAGSIIAYGILPRALLLLLSLLLRWQAGRHFRLDTSRPGYSRLRNRLMPVSRTIGIIDTEETPETAYGEETLKDEALLAQTTGPIAILGLEIDPPQSDWPPPLEGIDWLDLGFVDDRSQRHHALERILSALQKPRLIVVVCSLTATPDRGTRAFVHELQHTSHLPVIIVLTEGQHLRNRGDGKQVAQRLADWRQIAAEAKVKNERVMEVDLDHLTDVSRTKLAKRLGIKPSTLVTQRRVEKAFAVILEHLNHWTQEPNASEQAELHRQIAQLYRGERQSWQALLQTKAQEGGNQVAQLQTSASRMMDLLPDRLRRSSKWLAAGALTGAMGCVAASTLVTPAAIAALPAWVGLGAAISAALQPLMPKRENVIAPERIDLTEAVNSAALFAIVLELQGRDEATITRIIDQVAIENEPPPIANPAAARTWLDTLRQRLDLALARERGA